VFFIIFISRKKRKDSDRKEMDAEKVVFY